MSRPSPPPRPAGAGRGVAAVWAAAVALAVAAPFLLASYQVFQLATAMAFVPVIAGLLVLTGVAGQVSLGHGALFAIGAYATAIAIDRAGLPFPLAALAAVAVTGAVGVVVGLPALRLHGMQLALVTVAFAVALPPLLLRFDGLTGGIAGITLEPVAAPSWSGLADDQWIYLCALAVALAALALVAALLRSRLGLALRAVEADELAAQAAGVDLARTKTLAFSLSAMLAGAAGAVYVLVVGFVSPESFPLLLGIAFLVGMVVGGTGSVAGPLLGALFVQFAPAVAGDVHDDLGGVVYGVAVVLVVLALPGGATSLAPSLRRLVRRGGGAPFPTPQHPEEETA